MGLAATILCLHGPVRLGPVAVEAPFLGAASREDLVDEILEQGVSIADAGARPTAASKVAGSQSSRSEMILTSLAKTAIGRHGHER
jgi:hypothetical protein